MQAFWYFLRYNMTCIWNFRVGKTFIKNFVFRSFIFICKIQKQFSGGVLKKRCSQKCRWIHRKTPASEYLFLIKLQVWAHANLLRQRLQRRYFSINLAKFLRTLSFYRTPQVAALEKSLQFTISVLKSLPKKKVCNKLHHIHSLHTFILCFHKNQ